jgi:hypothetical protein
MTSTKCFVIVAIVIIQTLSEVFVCFGISFSFLLLKIICSFLIQLCNIQNG